MSDLVLTDFQTSILHHYSSVLCTLRTVQRANCANISARKIDVLRILRLLFCTVRSLLVQNRSLKIRKTSILYVRVLLENSTIQRANCARRAK